MSAALVWAIVAAVALGIEVFTLDLTFALIGSGSARRRGGGTRRRPAMAVGSGGCRRVLGGDPGRAPDRSSAPATACPWGHEPGRCPARGRGSGPDRDLRSRMDV